MRQRPSIFLVDDDKPLREALTIALSQSGYSVQAFPTGTDFLEFYQTPQPGCLVIDLRLPDMTGIEVQANLRAKGYTLPCIFISGYGDIPTTVRAMQGGAADFIEKPFTRRQLVDRIEEVMAEHDQVATSERPTNPPNAPSADAQSIQALVGTLTVRELEIMRLITFAGLSSKEIARQLDISHRTVESHRAHLMRKLKVRKLAELCHIAEIHARNDFD